MAQIDYDSAALGFAAICKLAGTVRLSPYPPSYGPGDQFRIKMPDLTFRFDRSLFDLTFGRITDYQNPKVLPGY